MTDLLDFALEAHGGFDNWKGVTGVDLRLTLGGCLFAIKQHPDGLRTALVKVDARRPRTLIVPFPEQGKRGIYQEGKVWLQTDAGAMVEELPAPRTAYEGHERSTPWNDLQYLYFIGYAFWNYFTTPFLLASEGVICEEVEPWEENHQKWRVLRATFDSSIDTHCAVQKNVAHYCMDYKTFDGFVFPTRRRVVSRGDGEFTATGGPSSVLIDIESVVVNRE